MERRPYPGTGPYRIAAADGHRVVLKRNAYFREWSRAAQPQGNPDEIVWRFGLTPAAEARAVAAGRADWMWDNVPPSQLPRIEREHPGQLHASVAPETDFVQINSGRPPFDDLRVRKALNLAVDRARIARLYGAARQTCQVLPPGVPGYRRYCPYPHDLARARQLVRSAQAVGDHVSIVGFTDDGTISRAVFVYLAAVVRQLGLVPHLTWTTHAAFRDNPRFGLIPVGWYADYPAASDFFGVWFACNGPYNNGKYCDATLDRQIRTASDAEAVDPQRAATLWAAADRRAVDQAASVPFANPTIYDFTSARVRRFQHHLLWGFLADQVELR
jgi:peptide/nickel transport system substrate-binding protein